MLPNDAFQKLLYDLFCVWHDVRRHYDPPINYTEEEKMVKVGSYKILLVLANMLG